MRRAVSILIMVLISASLSQSIAPKKLTDSNPRRINGNSVAYVFSSEKKKQVAPPKPKKPLSKNTKRAINIAGFLFIGFFSWRYYQYCRLHK